jgi:DNA polymerase-3 subunit epsilon
LICPEHGAFTRLPNQILNSTFGCPECANKVKEDAHAQAVARKENEKRQKEEVANLQRQELFAQLDERITHLKRDIDIWVKKQNPATLKRQTTEFCPWIAYKRLVDARIDDVRYASNDRELYRKPFFVEPCQAVNYPHYEDGDFLYRFPGEAPHPLFEELFNAHQYKCKDSFAEELEHRDCKIQFIEGDLIIIFKYSKYWSYQQQKQFAVFDTQHNQQITLPSTFVAVDFETLYSQRVSACSVGLVKYVDGIIVDRYYSLIRPPFDYEGKCGFPLTNIHGISKDDLYDQRTMEQILPELETFIGDLPLVAHNAPVERGCFRDTLAFYNLKSNIKYETIIDTLKISKEVEQQLGIYETGEGTHTIDAVCRRFALKDKKHHYALDDAEMAGNLIFAFKHALETGKIGSIEIPEKIVRTQEEPIIEKSIEEKQSNTSPNEGGLFSFFKRLFS